MFDHMEASEMKRQGRGREEKEETNIKKVRFRRTTRVKVERIMTA